MIAQTMFCDWLLGASTSSLTNGQVSSQQLALTSVVCAGARSASPWRFRARFAGGGGWKVL